MCEYEFNNLINQIEEEFGNINLYSNMAINIFLDSEILTQISNILNLDCNLSSLKYIFINRFRNNLHNEYIFSKYCYPAREEQIILEFNKNIIYIISKDYKIEKVEKYEPRENIEEYYIHVTNFETIYDYTNLLRDLYHTSKLDDVKECNEFISFVNYFLDQIRYHRELYPSEHDIKINLIVDLISEYVKEKGYISKSRKVSKYQFEKSKQDIKSILSKVDDIINRKTRYIFRIIFGNSDLISSRGPDLDEMRLHLNRYDNMILYIETRKYITNYEYEYENYEDVLKVLSQGNEDSIKFINLMTFVNIFRQYIIIMNYSENVYRKFKSIFLENDYKYMHNIVASIYKYMVENNLITFNFDEIFEFIVRNEYIENLSLVYYFIEEIPQNMINNPKYNKQDYFGFVEAYIRYIVYELVESNKATDLILNIYNMVIARGLLVFLSELDDEDYVQELIEYYNMKLREMFIENNIEEYVDMFYI